MRTIDRDIVGAFIFSADNKVLLGYTGVFEGSWCVPGGGIEPDETKEDAVIREIREETGLDISSVDKKLADGVGEASSEKVLRDTREKVFVNMRFYDYVVNLNENAEDIVIVSDDDFRDATWFSQSDLTDIKLSPATRKRLIDLGYISD